ncbi:hypothetical protein [Alkalibacterium olivapovliticus]|uniref:Uncharacterized protein n=1 Tax=Alkalibacterium olivapovliticus TaxID=99907 RepID=A0A2T0WA33_9LACT|nr:hypothetical protein [Alkalibacterium olivapovliticus]PRY83579.1 hypothetical protein CLV38_1032 [Alkalibacterium olivapovliticus]
MQKWSTKSLLIINGVILLFILFNLASNEQPSYVYPEERDDSMYAEPLQVDITQLSENTILMVNNISYSDEYGKMTVLEYDEETNRFSTISDSHHVYDFVSDLGYLVD